MTTPSYYEPTTHRRGSSPSPPSGEKFERGANKTTGGIRSAAAKIHGTGEAIRGHAMAAVDSATRDLEGEQKNRDIAHAGEREMDTGHFHAGREGRERSRAERGTEGLRGEHEHESGRGLPRDTGPMDTGETGHYIPTGHTTHMGTGYSGFQHGSNF
ncbi:hypothetical protein VTO42DRAFT_2044 [Malbranchea cinnamomea]